MMMIIYLYLTHCGVEILYGIKKLVNNSFNNGLLPDDIKPLNKPMLTVNWTLRNKL